MKNHERGLTLNELIISLTVVGILTGIGVPRLAKTVANYRLSTAAGSLLVQIHRAKLSAIREGTVYYLDFDFDADGNVESEDCFLWVDRNGNRHKEILEQSQMVFDLESFPGVHLHSYPYEQGGPKRGPNKRRIEAGGGDGVTFPQNRIKFNPNGTCSTGTVYLHNSNGRTFAIRIRFNGLTQLWRHFGLGWERW